MILVGWWGLLWAMKHTLFRIATVLIITGSAIALDVKQLSPMHQALYGAMRAGYTIGAAGGTEADMETVFLKVKAGDTNAVQDWLNTQKLK